jgi:hypothetical protein
MTENLHDPQRIKRHLVWSVALAVVALAGCSSTAGSTAGHAAPGAPATPTVTVAPPAAAPIAAQGSTPTVTVTVAPPAAPAAQQSGPNGPAAFRSPSGNISCTLSTPGGENAARCEVVDHAWVATSPPDCHLNWGDRLYLTQGGEAGFGCYAQEFPTAQQTLGYGQTLSLGTITCDSEPAGMTCTDGSTGHYFRVSRETYAFG